MSQVIKKEKKLKNAIILSMILHIILMIFCLRSSFPKNIISVNNSSVIDTIMMVNIDSIEDKSTFHQNKNITLGKEKNQKIQEQLQKNRTENDMQEKGKKNLNNEVKKDNLDIRKNREVKTTIFHTEKKENNNLLMPLDKLVTNKKNHHFNDKIIQKSKQEKKTKNYKNINNIINNLIFKKPSSEIKQYNKVNITSIQIQKEQLNTINQDIEIKNYLNQVKVAIQSKFYDANSFTGKVCNIRIKLSPDGLLTLATSLSGDPALCLAALNASHAATIPQPPNKGVWLAVKEATVAFKP